MSNSLFFLQIGLAFIFAFAGIDGLREPAAWLGFLPTSLPLHILPSLALDIASYLQVALSLALLWRPVAAYASLIALAMLLGITLTSLSTFLITFRDIGLACMALALLFLAWPERYIPFRTTAQSLK